MSDAHEYTYTVSDPTGDCHALTLPYPAHYAVIVHLTAEWRVLSCHLTRDEAREWADAFATLFASATYVAEVRE